jgi:hypothetical protein
MSKIVFLVDTSFLNSDSLKLEHIFATKIMQYFDINLGKFFYYNFFDCFENNIFFENSIIYYYVSYQRVDELIKYIWNYDNAIYCCHVIIIHENNGPGGDSLLKINYNEIIKRAIPKGILISSIIVSEDKIENLLKFITFNDNVDFFSKNKIMHLDSFYKNNIFLQKKEIIFNKFFISSCSELVYQYDKTRFVALENNSPLSLLNNNNKKLALLPRNVYDLMFYYSIKQENFINVVNYYFDKIYVLCLHGRENKTEKQLLKHGISNYKLFNGLYGKNSILCKNEYQNYVKKHPVLPSEKDVLNGKKRRAISSVGSWAILKSMYNMIKDAQINCYNRILVLQDDTIFCDNFCKIFKEKVLKVNDDWKLLYLGASQYDWSSVKIINKNHYNTIGNTDGAFAVGIHNSVYEELLENITEFNIPFDSGPLWNIQKKYPKDCYVIYNNIIIADVRSSDLRKSRNIYNTANMFRWDLKYFCLDN